MVTAQPGFEPELRRDPITGTWVIMADRGGRPSGKVVEKERPKSVCPFEPGREDRTPPETWAVRPEGQPNGPGWLLRVVPNAFPALRRDLGLQRAGLGLLEHVSGYGVHEVIVETPDHYAQLRTMSAEQACLILDAYAKRLADLRSDPKLRHVVVFRNYRARAGASLSHPHSQVIALPIVPRLVKEKLSTARQYYAQHERCIFCDLIRQELSEGCRLVAANEDFLALVPYAARFPYEVHIYPRCHQHDFVLLQAEQKRKLVQLLQEVLQSYYELLGDHEKGLNVPYNMVLQTAPNPAPRPGRPDYWGTLEADYHWHIELIPRLSKMAGFEWGSGFYINPVLPERAAAQLQSQRQPAAHKMPRL
jgi:UDPglucose--hexose-1-phosphate uridylyltransferase